MEIDISPDFALTPMGSAYYHFVNNQVRSERFASIMRRRLGRGWKGVLCQATVYEQLVGPCEAVMLEKLDRAGRLTDALTLEQVAVAIKREVEAREQGWSAGTAYAAQQSVPPVPRELFMCPVPEAAEVFGVEGEFSANCTSWLDGFLAGAAWVWWPPWTD
jgi:hypothetical protein